MADIINRIFPVERDGRVMEYVFSTFSFIFDPYSFDVTSNHRKLRNYLLSIFQEGYEERTGKKSVSEGPILNGLKTVYNSQDKLCQFASESNYLGCKESQHEVLQGYFLRNVDGIVCTELPVFDEEWHGHIDLVKIFEDGRVQILDFKPNAHREKKAASQLYRYRHLFSLRTGIDLADISIAYFDHESLYNVIY